LPRDVRQRDNSIMRGTTLGLVVLTACSVEAESLPAHDRAQPRERDVTAVVTSAGRLTPGIELIFHDAEGRVIARAITDANGEAGAALPEHGMVTAFYVGTNAERPLLLTVRDVVAGDRVVFDFGRYRSRDSVPIEVVLQGAFTEANGRRVENYEIHTAHGFLDIHDPKSFTYRAETLPVRDRVSVYARAVNAWGCTVAYAVASATVDADGAGRERVELSEWRTDLQWVEASGFGFDAGLVVDGVRCTSQIRESGFCRTGLAAPMAGVELGIRASIGDDRGHSEIARRVRVEAVIELAENDFMSARHDVVLETSERSRPVLDFTIEGEVRDADALAAELVWDLGEWIIFAAPEARQIRAPELPDDLADFRLRSIGGAALHVIDRDSIHGYAEFRVLPSSRLDFDDPGRLLSARTRNP
jgi:hypothetical protein